MSHVAICFQEAGSQGPPHRDTLEGSLNTNLSVGPTAVRFYGDEKPIIIPEGSAVLFEGRKIMHQFCSKPNATIPRGAILAAIHYDTNG